MSAYRALAHAILPENATLKVHHLINETNSKQKALKVYFF